MSSYLPSEPPFKVPMHQIVDDRGELFVLEHKSLPFVVNRYFVITVGDKSITRGGHAHKSCWQAMNPQGGACSVLIKNLRHTEFIEITPSEVLVVPPYNWCEVRFESSLTRVSVFASQEFDSNDYIYAEPGLKN
jgi:hypothetical protein